MKISLAVACIFFLVLSAKAANKLEIDDENEEDFIPFAGERKDRFDWVLCSMLDDRVPGNVVASPISVKLLLTMLYESASGESARNLEKALQLTEMKTVNRAQSSALLQTLQAKNKNYDLEIGTRFYINSDLKAKNWYKRILSLYYGTFIEKIDFDDPKSMIKINSWAEYVTHGHIKKLFYDAEALRGTSLVLVNAVYFQGTWKTPFQESDSFTGMFQSPEGPQSVRFMTRSGLYYLTESQELDAQFLRLPYKGNKFSMYIVLPKRVDGLNSVLSKMSPFHVRRMVGQLEETLVEVILPSFNFEFVMNLKEVLSKMGLDSIFTNSNDFHGIKSHREEGKIVVSNVLQKASIHVTEKGTVAAAATEMELIHKTEIQPETIFNASHPFCFFIEDEHTGTVIFEGKLVYPNVISDKLDIPESGSIIPTATSNPLSVESYSTKNKTGKKIVPWYYDTERWNLPLESDLQLKR